MDCIWCFRGQALEEVVGFVTELPTGAVYAHRDQTHPGRCIFAYHEHVQKMSALSQAEFTALMGDVHVVVRALTEAFQPDKVNIMVIGDASTHMHIHICPKYRDGKDWGKPFCLNEPEPVLKSEPEMDSIIENIRERIELCQKY